MRYDTNTVTDGRREGGWSETNEPPNAPPSLTTLSSFVGGQTAQ